MLRDFFVTEKQFLLAIFVKLKTSKIGQHVSHFNHFVKHSQWQKKP